MGVFGAVFNFEVVFILEVVLKFEVIFNFLSQVTQGESSHNLVILSAINRKSFFLPVKGAHAIFNRFGLFQSETKWLL